MNFDFSDDQKLIQAEANKFLSQQCTIAEVRSILDNPKTSYHQSLWQQIAELGWLGTAIPEQYGGLGLGYLELCVIAEAMGKALAPVPFSSTAYLLTETIKLAGSEQQKTQWLPQIAAGNLIGCLAVSEGYGHSLSQQPNCSIKDAQLSGQKIAVADGDIADLAVVFASDGNHNSLYLVSLDQDSVTTKTVDSLDPSRSYANIDFQAADCQLLGSRGEGHAILKQLYDIAAVLFAFEQIGGCQVALDKGIEYTKNRYAFGRPVASFQAIKHKFADLFVAKELATSNTYYGAMALQSYSDHSDGTALPLAAATARVSASNAFYQTAKESLQAHGGMGFTWEFDCHLYYRRAQVLSMNMGSLNYWKNQISDELLNTPTNNSVHNLAGGH